MRSWLFRVELQRLLAAEQALERKERKAEKLERIFLAEEEQEQKILKQKLDAARAVSTSNATVQAALCDWAIIQTPAKKTRSDHHLLCSSRRNNGSKK